MKKMCVPVFVFLLFVVFNAGAVERYVNLNNPTPLAPYTNWETAATNIQDAVEICNDGDTVWVTNGVYRSGESLTPFSSESKFRVWSTNAITIRSVNGPAVTYIEGSGPFGSNSVSCLFLKGDSFIDGFTLTNGYASDSSGMYEYYHGSGGGAFLADGVLMTNCVVVECYAKVFGGGVVCLGETTIKDCLVKQNTSGGKGGGIYVIAEDYAFDFAGPCLISECEILDNHSASAGGGVRFIQYGVSFEEDRLSSSIVNSIVAGNVAEKYGGGAAGYWNVIDCVVSNNWAGDGGGGLEGANAIDSIICDNWSEGNGGGMWGGTASDCIVRDNIALFSDGGGLYRTSATNCIISGNEADNGGGSYNFKLAYDNELDLVELDNCLVYGNTAWFDGGGVYSGLVYNCTISDNSASLGGGMLGGGAFNSIVYHNTGNDMEQVSAAASCSPDLTHGQYGNITNAPIFANRLTGDYRLDGSSPCIDAGVNGYARAQEDFDGNPRVVGTVDMGVYERQTAGSDSDGDGLADAAELKYGTSPSNPDSDGDGFEDGWEVGQGWNPIQHNDAVMTYIDNHQSVFGYYTSNSIGDLAMGAMIIGVSNSTVDVSLQMMQSSDLVSWTNLGQAVQWSVPATNKAYFRFHAQP
jgi:parallel beta-helix repeat protein/predicted outer membrane repeat protein